MVASGTTGGRPLWGVGVEEEFGVSLDHRVLEALEPEPLDRLDVEPDTRDSSGAPHRVGTPRCVETDGWPHTWLVSGAYPGGGPAVAAAGAADVGVGCPADDGAPATAAAST